MTRTLAILLIACAATAHADIAVEPPAERNCPRAASWDALEKCLAKVNIAPRPLRSLPDARLVMLEQTKPSVQQVGVYLYVQHDKGWQLAGVMESVGAGFELLAFEPLTMRGRTAYRFDYGLEMPMTVEIEGRHVHGLLRMTRSKYCSGDQAFDCVDVTTQCELLVRGRALYVFHGTAKLERARLTVEGDIRHAGTMCAAATRMGVSWADPTP